MIYAPIKYKKVDASSPFYLNCLSYSITSTKANKTHTSAKKILSIKQNTESAIIAPTIVAENANMGQREVLVDNGKIANNEIKPVCKQSAREKLNEFKTTFSQKFDAAFGQKLESTKGAITAKLSKDSTKTESVNSEDKVSRTEILKTKFDNFFNRENKNTETENDSNHYAKFKAKVNSFLDKCKNAKIDLKISSKKKNNTTKNDFTNYELDETLQAMAFGIQNQSMNFDSTTKAMALDIQETESNSFEVDEILGAIAKNLQEENQFTEDNKTLTTPATASSVKETENKMVDGLAHTTETKDNAVVESSIVEESSTTAGTPASALDDIAQIQETLLANGSFESKTTLSQKLSNGVAKLKNYFASKNRNETQNEQNGIEASQEIDYINEEVITDDDNQKAEIVAEEKTKNVESTDSITDLDEHTTCESTIDETPTSREDVCEIPENVTHKRKSYYALKIENAKKHIINSGVRVKKAANKIVNAFKSTLATPEVVEYEDKDDYRKYGMKNIETDPFFETESNLIMPEEKDTTTSMLCKDTLESSIQPKVNAPTVLAQEKPKSYRFTTLDEYFEL